MTWLHIKNPNTKSKKPQNLRNFLLNHLNFEAECVDILAKKPMADHLVLDGDFMVSWVYLSVYKMYSNTTVRWFCLCLNENVFFSLVIWWFFTVISENKTLFSYLIAQTFSSYLSLSPESKLPSQLACSI